MIAKPLVLACISRVLMISLLPIFAAVGGAWAQSVPEYDGVYLRLKDGSLVQLNPIKFRNERFVLTSKKECGALVCYGIHRISDPIQMRETGVVDLRELGPGGEITMNLSVADGLGRFATNPLLRSGRNTPVSIVIRGKKPKLRFVGQVVDLADYIKALKRHPLASGIEFPNSFASGRKINTGFRFTLIKNRWGCRAETFKVRRMDIFTTEYVEDGCSLLQETSIAPLFGVPLVIRAYVVETEQGIYGYMNP